MDTSFPSTLHAHQLVNIMKILEKKISHRLLIVLHMCTKSYIQIHYSITHVYKVLYSNLLYFICKKKKNLIVLRVKSVIILSFFFRIAI